jgi:putative aldouronate transport system permease protein
MVTVTRTVLGTTFGLLVQTMTAYVLAYKHFQGRKFFTKMVVFTILFNGGIIPNYLVIQRLQLLDTVWALILPMVLNPWNVLLLISFFAAIPSSIIESAKLDGANDFTIYRKLAVPLSKPAILTILLYIAVRHWNELMDGVIYINNNALKPMQVYLIELIMRSSVQNMIEPTDNFVTVLSIQTTAIFVSCLPILIVYPIIQKHFVKGIMIGGVKG